MDKLQRRVYYLRIDRDADLIAWLDAQRNTGQTVRTALYQLKDHNGRLDAEMIESAVTRAVERALSGLSLAGPVPAPDGGGEDEKAGAMIDDLLGQF